MTSAAARVTAEVVLALGREVVEEQAAADLGPARHLVDGPAPRTGAAETVRGRSAAPAAPGGHRRCGAAGWARAWRSPRSARGQAACRPAVAAVQRLLDRVGQHETRSLLDEHVPGPVGDVQRGDVGQRLGELPAVPLRASACRCRPLRSSTRHPGRAPSAGGACRARPEPGRTQRQGSWHGRGVHDLGARDHHLVGRVGAVQQLADGSSGWPGCVGRQELPEPLDVLVLHRSAAESMPGRQLQLAAGRRASRPRARGRRPTSNPRATPARCGSPRNSSGRAAPGT